MARTDFDIAIVGGGMVGATAALSFSQLGLKVALVEAVEPEQDISPSFDQRAIALSAASVAIFETLGLWPSLSPLACPIAQIHVSDRGHFGFTRLSAKEFEVPAMGQVIPLEMAGPVLWDHLRKDPAIECFCPARVVDRSIDENNAILELEYEQDSASDCAGSIRAKLVIAADGTFSPVARMAGIQIDRQDYGQVAIIANIATDQAHHNRAFERFTENGPLALLPLTQNRLSLVWCHHPTAAEEIMAKSDESFIEALQKAFGFRLGNITRVGERSSYPLGLHQAQTHFSQRVVLLGNSAHTLHPIAGQGFNLGLRDIAALNDCLREVVLNRQEIGSHDFLQAYASARAADWQQTIAATDSLTRLFSHEFLPIKLARNCAMNWINRLPFAKRQLARVAMGYGQRSSRLARGLGNQNIRD